MSMYLFDEQPILANKALARELGLKYKAEEKAKPTEKKEASKGAER